MYRFSVFVSRVTVSLYGNPSESESPESLNPTGTGFSEIGKNGIPGERFFFEEPVVRLRVPFSNQGTVT